MGMDRRVRNPRLFGLALVFIGFMAALAPNAPARAEEPIGPLLPQNVRDMLLEEMAAVLGASMQILDALVRGEDAIVAEQAQAIHDSFILEQQMTEADLQALMAVAPPDFLELDGSFHELAANLAEAARAGEQGRQRELFATMVESCAVCHERYATNLFPGFGQ